MLLVVFVPRMATAPIAILSLTVVLRHCDILPIEIELFPPIESTQIAIEFAMAALIASAFVPIMILLEPVVFVPPVPLPNAVLLFPDVIAVNA